MNALFKGKFQPVTVLAKLFLGLILIPTLFKLFLEEKNWKGNAEKSRKSGRKLQKGKSIILSGSADEAYPSYLGIEHQEILLSKAFLRGLRDYKLLCKTVAHGNPTTVEEVITAVTKCTDLQERIQRISRRDRPQEEAMEVDAMTGHIKFQDEIRNSLAALTTKINHLDKKQASRAKEGREANQRSVSTLASRYFGTPFRCYCCGRSGHFARECPDEFVNKQGQRSRQMHLNPGLKHDRVSGARFRASASNHSGYSSRSGNSKNA